MKIKQFIENHIPQMDTPEKVYELFNKLGYNTLDLSYRGKEAWGLREKDKETVDKIYAIANYEKRFQILLVELKSLSTQIIKSLTFDLEREIQYPLIIFTSDYRNYTIALVEKIRKDAGEWRRKIIKLNFNRTNAYYTDRMVISNTTIDTDDVDPKTIYSTLHAAFSVEKVSKIFFEDYKTSFFAIRDFLLKQNINIKQAHEFAQQLLNRIMFIYFIDKKMWLKNSPKFMKWFWDRYCEDRKKKGVKDQFYKKWLEVLFLEAFNNRFSHPQYLPQDIREALALAPYLNGGLFKRNELDDLEINLPDDFNETILKFFEKYNFTIRENLPLDVEVAVDPQMIGYVYESLANVAEEIYERQDLGIFYTPKVEVDFMCCRSLLEYLTKTTDIPKNNLYHLVFDVDKTKVEKNLKFNNCEKLEDALDNLSVLDPTCGSGAFLVGMLNIMVELYKLIFKKLNRQMTDYQLKKRIIGNSLYGVDVMPWAAHSAELRLWLSLMIESDLTVGELKTYPLLPNLSLKLRIGDSLVQEIGGLNLNVRDITISQPLKRKLLALKVEKEKYYNNDPIAKYKTDEAVIQAELHLFHEILNERIVNLTKKKQALSMQRGDQYKLFEKEISQEAIFNKKDFQVIIDREKNKIDEEVASLSDIKNKLVEKKPFIWDIDFAEIFGDKGGFDIVIGNPPYVRQEKISPPNRLRNEVSNEDKREYKEKLLKSIQAHFPFIKRIDKKSDYYVYFYFHGLSLLNEKGTFCFITSNSWLDVGYGKDLQEFLLKHIPIIAIYDNQAKRSFEHADINTIIALFNAPSDLRQPFPALQQTAKFIMFKKSFDEVINIENLLKIEDAKTVLATDDFRIYPKKQVELLEEGWEYPEEATEEQKKAFTFNIGKYSTNKWGGKYLRAPDIYFKFIKDLASNFEPLDQCGELGIGLVTGANRFFIIDEETIKLYNLSNRYIYPIVKSPKELERILIDSRTLQLKLLMLADETVIDRYFQEYIKEGEKQEYHLRPTCKARNPWYKLDQKPAPILFPYIIGKRHMSFLNESLVFTSRELERYIPFSEELIRAYCAYFNSTIIALFREIMGRVNLGDGALKLEVLDIKKMPVFSHKNMMENKSNFESCLLRIGKRRVMPIFEECGINPKQSIRLQKPNPLPDRKALDNIVFDILGLTPAERNEVYWSVCELVKNRLDKARSV